MSRIQYLLILLVVAVTSCKKEGAFKLFTELSSDDTGITFKNLVRESEEFNVLTYGYFHQGGGVAIGDMNNDSLPDIYFTGNMIAGKLYINKGQWVFEEIAEKAGVRAEGLWNTGTTIADVDGDGWLDIYVCRSAANDPNKRKNLLFINNGDLTFTEKAESLGLADPGYSTQASFFDYDRDGDLDMFSLNHSTQEFAGFSRVTGNFKNRKDPLLGSKLFRNDGTHFTNVTEAAGIINNVLGFGLAVTVTDINNDNWLDIYVSNDYNEEDYFYLNQKNGTFRECLKEHFGHVSFFSMGADAADINNDLKPDIITLDMLPENSYNQKMILGPENYEKYRELLSNGFFPQTMRNMLHLNQGNGYFSEIGQLAGISSTDWSWSVLAADYDNDGWKDLMITNGYMRNYLDMDFLSYVVGEKVNLQQENKDVVLLDLINKMPPIKVQNYLYKNNGNLTFTKVSDEWGMENKTVSNAAAYGDLDNDGDLDLVICHTNQEASIFRNNSEVLNKNNFLKIKLRGTDKNTFGIGAKVTLYDTGMNMYQEMIPVRGFQSSVNHEFVFGLGKINTIDSLTIIWPDSSVQTLYSVQANQRLLLMQSEAKKIIASQRPVRKIVSEETDDLGIVFSDAKNPLLDFKRDRMMPNSISTTGPKIIEGDINNDGLKDLFLAGTNGGQNKLFVQLRSGRYVPSDKNIFKDGKPLNDKDAIFLDVDRDGDQDLYVVSGMHGNQENSPESQDRLYSNDGIGNFLIQTDALPQMLTNGSSVTAGDFNNDGFIDVFVGGRSIPGKYPMSPRSYLLQNNGKGKFSDVTAEFCPDLLNPGMVTDAQFVKLNNDPYEDLVVVGEWMRAGIYINDGGKKLVQNKFAVKENTSGWWLSIEANDFDKDGDSDLVLGNFGLNNPYHPDITHPMKLIYKDFDNNGSIDPIFHYYMDDTLAFAYSRDELIGQIPSMKKKFTSYQSFASAKLSDFFTTEQLSDSDTLSAVLMETIYLENDGDGNFALRRLPIEAQFSPVYALASLDINGDGHLDFVTAGNLSQTRVSSGKHDANYGIVFLGDGNGSFKTMDPATSGLSVRGDVRDISIIRIKGADYILMSRNGDSIKVFRIRPNTD